MDGWEIKLVHDSAHDRLMQPPSRHPGTFLRREISMGRHRTHDGVPAVLKGVMKRPHEARFPDSFWRRGTSLSIDAKGLYAVLVTFADYRTGETYVTNLRLQLETRHGVVKIKNLLSELERAGFIKRWQEPHGNLKAKRHIRCLKYIDSPVVQIPSHRPGGIVFGPTENQPTIRTPVKSSVTPEKQEESSFPHTQEKPERIM